MLTYGDSALAEQTPPDRRSKILHATLFLGDQRLTGADAAPESYRKPQGFAVTLSIADVKRAECIFNSLAENGTVEMPLQETFWAVRFGVLIDQFGTPWQINCAKPQPV
ncbi:MAG: VOC family protein [Candidatus Binataceae bacterium]